MFSGCREGRVENKWVKIQIGAIIQVLTLPALFISESCIKINVNFYFHASLWCFKRFYEGF